MAELNEFRVDEILITHMVQSGVKVGLAVELAADPFFSVLSSGPVEG